MPRQSASCITPPVGLFGKFAMSAFVRGVMLSASASAVSRNSSSARQGTVTGTPPARETQGV